jgi:hypothetical protein
MFLDAINKVNNGEVLSESYIEEAKNKMKKFNDILSCGFYNSSLNDLIYLNKEQYAEGEKND